MQNNDLKNFIESQSANTLRWYQRNLIDIMNDNWAYIIDAQLKDIFIQDTITKMRPFITKEFNLFKSVIKSISQVYKSKAVRTVKDASGADDEVYAAIKDAGIDSVMKSANIWSNALSHVVVRPRVVYGKLRYDLLTFDNCTVMLDENDSKRMIGIQYFTGLRIPDYEGVLGGSTKYGTRTYTTGYKSLDGVSTYNYEDYSARHCWTIETIDGVEQVVYRRYERGNGLGATKAGDKLTEEKYDVYRDADGFAKLPFTLISATDTSNGVNFSGGSDIVDATIGIAVLMVQLYHIIKTQSFKQVVLSGATGDIPPKMYSDPAAWMTTGKDVSISMLDLQSDYIRLWQAIKERVVMVLAQYGIPPNDFLQTSSPSSGFAKIVENAKLIERREQDIPRYEDYESAIYKDTVMVWNKDKISTSPDMMRDAEFHIEFGDMGLPVDVATIVQEETHDLMNGVITPVDIIMRRKAGITREQAEQIYAQNKMMNALNKTVEGPQTLTIADDTEDTTEE